jgi:hypothetical protein
MNYNDYLLNGRVNIIDKSKKTAKICNNTPMLYNENVANTINRNFTGTCLAENYFSKENIDIVQEGIINSVYNKSQGKYTISRQSDSELLIVMRSIYFQYGKNLTFDIKQQIRDLNIKVINWCVDEIITNINQYINYTKAVSTLPMVMEHAQLPSMKGTKTLEIKTFI